MYLVTCSETFSSGGVGDVVRASVEFGGILCLTRLENQPYREVEITRRVNDVGELRVCDRVLHPASNSQVVNQARNTAQCVREQDSMLFFESGILLQVLLWASLEFILLLWTSLDFILFCANYDHLLLYFILCKLRPATSLGLLLRSTKWVILMF